MEHKGPHADDAEKTVVPRYHDIARSGMPHAVAGKVNCKCWRTAYDQRREFSLYRRFEMVLMNSAM